LPLCNNDPTRVRKRRPDQHPLLSKRPRRGFYTNVMVLTIPEILFHVSLEDIIHEEEDVYALCFTTYVMIPLIANDPHVGGLCAYYCEIEPFLRFPCILSTGSLHIRWLSLCGYEIFPEKNLPSCLHWRTRNYNS